jgi:hypothetical protein
MIKYAKEISQVWQPRNECPENNTVRQIDGPTNIPYEITD